MNISIIGAARKRNGIGQYIAKFFNYHGARVTSVLGTSQETSQDAARTLGKYGIESTPYTDFKRMIDQERPDAVVIASPSMTHYEYLAKSADSGLHIFCEKPFVWPGHTDTTEKVEKILKKVKEKKLILAMNSQWPFALSFYQRICGEIEMNPSNRFVIQMSPFIWKGNDSRGGSPRFKSSLFFFWRRPDNGIAVSDPSRRGDGNRLQVCWPG
jgi:hypothetical protein